ncbi:MAG: radical SAM peptide maturase [Bacteroidetes bacterium]|nr:radical SAM peptide maturase [Bacteroidota bacterium]MCL2303333.1 radical SAM peptide maturase [Lentimicrobiaceae bacterium]
MSLNYIIFKTKDNYYLYSEYKNQILLLHPLMYYLLLLNKKGINLEEWISTVVSDISIDNIGTFSQEEVIYQYHKLIFLKANKFFENVSHKLLKYTAKYVKQFVANTRNVSFEVTDNCNLSCDYCIYGKYYNISRKIQNKKMNINVAKKVIDYILSLKNSSFNSSYNQKIGVGFYGGEPLLNFDFIEYVVSYLKEQPDYQQENIEIRMTTNGVLLDKYMDFLANNNVILKISLDGNTEKNNSYRKYHDGTLAFKKIIQNVKLLQQKHPEYFKKYVDLFSVLHDKNSVMEIEKLAQSFEKSYNISELSTDSLNSAFQEDFWKMHKPTPVIVLDEEKDKPSNPDQLNFHNLIGFVRDFSGYVKHSYLSLMQHQDVDEIKLTPAGTCQIFSRMFFITVDGLILPCERIDHRYSMGSVDDSGINLDFDKVANNLNTYYSKVYDLCKKCIHNFKCEQCMFHLGVGTPNFRCNHFLANNDVGFAKFLSNHITVFEQKPDLYLLTTQYKFI